MDLGAGEILITSIDQEGTKKGFDVDLIKTITDYVPIPVIACGGCGDPKHIIDLVKTTDIGAAACASIFHYNIFDIPAVKSSLRKENIQVRELDDVQKEYSYH